MRLLILRRILHVEGSLRRDSSVTQRRGNVMGGSKPNQSGEKKFEHRSRLDAQSQVIEDRGGLPKDVWQTLLGQYYPGARRREIGNFSRGAPMIRRAGDDSLQPGHSVSKAQDGTVTGFDVWGDLWGTAREWRLGAYLKSLQGQDNGSFALRNRPVKGFSNARTAEGLALLCKSVYARPRV